jgi:hypothetical protein
VVAARYDERLVEPLPAAVTTGDPDIRFGAIEETSAVELLTALPDGSNSLWVTLAEVRRTHGNSVRVDQAGRRRARAHP